ncbi:MAG: UDP-N-acetylmuramoyl-L-alanine--D-glutamate ligase, partial [Candidatus Limnocylindrales bacterium]
LVEELPFLTPAHRVVLELSELQLPTLSRGTDISVYTHVTADHLDRHGSVEAYRAAKRRLAELLPSAGTLVLNGDDPVTMRYASLRPKDGALIVYRRSAPGAGEVGVVDGWIVGDGVGVAPVAELGVPGEHNVSNALAAAAVGLRLGIAPDTIRAAMRAFTGVEHRLEQVAVVDGVRFVNDSMGTQPDAVIAAIRSFPKPIVLICGGRGKDLPVESLASVVAERVTAAVCIGESGPFLADAFRAAGLQSIEAATDLPAAVDRADAIARELMAAGAPEPATVLMSPAAASFDMFVDYAARGHAFKDAVAALAAGREAGDRR